MTYHCEKGTKECKAYLFVRKVLRCFLRFADSTVGFRERTFLSFPMIWKRSLTAGLEGAKSRNAAVSRRTHVKHK